MHNKSLVLIVVVATGILALSFSPVNAQPPTPFPGGGSLQQPMTWEFVQGVDFGVFSNQSPVGRTTATVTPVLYGNTNSGCNATDFAGFPAGNIALLTRGICEFWIKLQNAEQAGASGVLVANFTTGVVNGNLLGHKVNIPALSITKALGDAYVALAATGVQLTLETHASGPQTPPGP